MNLMQILSLLIVFLIILIFVLIIVFFKINKKEKNEKEAKNAKNKSQDSTSVKTYKEYTRESIFNFMEFSGIQDNMIVQKDGKRFLMVIECQGVNYDLMSEVEKNSVEMGFMKVLNTLRTPIQIYIQTRTINLESSLQRYRDKLESLENELSAKQILYRKMEEDDRYSEEDKKRQRLEVIRQQNLCEYGKDIISNTERMSKNNNILRKKYYIIMSHYANNSDGEYLDKEEVKEAAFSDLYTRCQSLIRVLSSAEVIGRVLNSEELVDLLYNAYNRDEAETYGISKAQVAGYDDIYITAPDVLERRKKALDKKIEEKALDVAEDAVLFATNKREMEEKEENIEDLINELAKQMIDENEQYLGKEIADTAKEHIDSPETKEEGEADAKKTKTTKRVRKQRS